MPSREFRSAFLKWLHLGRVKTNAGACVSPYHMN